MGKKVDAITKELDQLTKMCQRSLHEANMRMQSFEQLNGTLFECNKELIARVMTLQKEGKVGSDVIELADGDKDAVLFLKTHYEMKDNAFSVLADLGKAITLLEAYYKRIRIVQKRIKDLISDRKIGIASSKSLPHLAKCEKAIGELEECVMLVIRDSKSLKSVWRL